MQSGSVDSAQHYRRRQSKRDDRRRIIPSLSITLPAGDVQPLDVSPLRVTESPQSCGIHHTPDFHLLMRLVCATSS